MTERVGPGAGRVDCGGQLPPRARSDSLAARPPEFAVGDRVRHYGRQWTRQAFATVTAVQGPYPDGSYEYRVEIDADASWILTGQSTWASYATLAGE